MATLTSSIVSPASDIFQLIESGTRLAISMGAHQAHLSHLSQEIGKESLDLNQIVLLVSLLKKFQEDRQQFETFRSRIAESSLIEDYDPSQPQLVPKGILISQIEMIIIPFADATISGNLIISRLLNRIQALFDTAVDKLTAYRQTRQGWADFCAANKELRNWVSIILNDEGNFIERTSWPLQSEQITHRRQLTERSLHLDYLAMSSKIGNFLRILDIFIERETPYKEFVESHLSTWPEEWRSQIVEIQQEASIPFREAYMEMVRRFYLKTNPYLSDPIYRDAFYQRLHQYAFGPHGVNASEWSNKELPYLAALIDIVNKNFVDNLTQNPIPT